MKSEELRIAKTESRFREVNERIAETAKQFGASEAEFVCECADPDCGQRIELSVADYERTRRDGAQFLVVPGHEIPGREQVKRTRPGYRIVAKLKAIGAAARRLNPRSQTT
jgi:hypothetical protein